MVIIGERQNDLTNCSYISWKYALYLAMTPYWLKIRHISSGNLSCTLPNFISTEVFKRVLKSPEKISKSDLNPLYPSPLLTFLRLYLPEKQSLPTWYSLISESLSFICLDSIGLLGNAYILRYNGHCSSQYTPFETKTIGL